MPHLKGSAIIYSANLPALLGVLESFWPIFAVDDPPLLLVIRPQQ